MDSRIEIASARNKTPAMSLSNTEQLAAEAFSKQAPVFDKIYGTDPAIQYKRKRIREHVERFIQPGSRILELNAGTGEDAIYFARLGHHVHATDISPAMQHSLIEKIEQQQLSASVTHELCSFTELEKLKDKGPYDYVFSNFAGLNCTGRLDKVLRELNGLLKPGGYATLVLLPKFCIWEFLLLFKGHFRTAFRRFSGKKGTKAHIEGVHFRCWYYNPSYVRKKMRNEFQFSRLEGLCSLIPPSYFEGFSVRHPRLYGFLRKKEEKNKTKWPWRSAGDYFIMTMQKRSV
jgi:ubiquinone/menaquinone biosynthesis C-methylase UbiE